MKKFDHQEGDTYEIGASGCPTHVPFRQWRGGEIVATGFGTRCPSPADIPVGVDSLFLAKPGADGKQAATYCPPMTSKGGSDGAVRSRAATPAYRSGWDATFAPRKVKGRAN